MSFVPVLAQPGFAAANPRYAEQWALERVGAPCAWARTTGSQAITVAVIDSGADMGHPDLVQRLRKDGFDFVDNDPDPSDAHGHGTHVSGIIAASLDNADGTIGLAPGVQILPVRVMRANGTGNDRSIAAGISYAVERGAQVINLSLGSTLLLAVPESSPLIGRAISEAIAAGVVVVVAAGNDFVPLPNAIVGANEDVIVVAATTRDDRKAAFSNSGPWIDISAPGERILSTMPTYEVYLTSAALPADERFQPGYDYMSGTSQAAPFVSALAALLLSAEPALTPAEVGDRLKAAATDIYPNHPSYYRRLRLLGAGLIDACATVGGTTASGPLDLLRGERGRLTLVVVASGLILLSVAGSAALIALSRRRARRRPVGSYGQPAPVRSALSAHPPPPSRPGGRIGDTLVAAQPIWGRLRLSNGPGQLGAAELRAAQLVIGRASDANITITGDPAISRHHARLNHSLGQASVEDLGSSHGTYVNGRRIATTTPLRRGDNLTLGQTTLVFEDH